MQPLFRNDTHAIQHHRAAGGTGRLVMTFSYFGFRDLDAPGFGDGFLLRHGYDVLSFKSRIDDWFQMLAPAALDLARGIRDDYDFAGAYGSSSGGYAAIALSGLLRPDAVVALSPQYAIDEDFDTRWAARAKALTWHHRITPEAIGNASFTLISDPRHPLDAAQMARLRPVLPAAGTRVIDVPYSGHPTGMVLAETGQLAAMVLALLDGRPAPRPDLRWSLLRRSRTFLSTLGWSAEQSGRTGLAELCYRRALTLGEPTPLDHHRLAEFLSKTGRVGEAIVLSRRSVELAPGVAPLAHFCSKLLQQGGRLDEALVLAERACRLDPGKPGYARYHDRLLKRAARAGIRAPEPGVADLT